MLWRWGVLAALSHWSDKSRNLAPWNLPQNTWTKSLVDLVNSKGGPYRCAIHRSIHPWFILIYRQRIAVPDSTSLYFWSFQVSFSNVFFASFLVCPSGWSCITQWGMAFNCVERVKFYATQLPQECSTSDCQRWRVSEMYEKRSKSKSMAKIEYDFRICSWTFLIMRLLQQSHMMVSL